MAGALAHGATGATTLPRLLGVVTLVFSVLPFLIAIFVVPEGGRTVDISLLFTTSPPLVSFGVVG